MTRPASRQAPAARPAPRAPAVQADTPWQNSADAEQEGESPWLMSYLDFMTVLVVLFVCLYAGEKIHSRTKALAAAPPVAPVQTAAKPAAKPAAVVRTEPPPAVTAHPVAVAAAPAPVASAVAEPPPPVPPAAPPVAAEPVPPPAQNSAAAPEPAAAPPAEAAMAAAPAAVADAPAAVLPPIPAALAERVRISRDAQKVMIEINDAILFQAGRAELSEDGKAVLNALQPALLAHPGAITVEGHTDDRPIATAQYPSNWELSAARASVVTRHLIGLGVPAERVRPVGHADTQPRADNATAEGRAQNRRVSLVLHSG